MVTNWDTGLADRGSSLTSSLPPRKRFTNLVTVVYDGALRPKVCHELSLNLFPK